MDIEIKIIEALKYLKAETLALKNKDGNFFMIENITIIGIIKNQIGIELFLKFFNAHYECALSYNEIVEYLRSICPCDGIELKKFYDINDPSTYRYILYLW